MCSSILAWRELVILTFIRSSTSVSVSPYLTSLRCHAQVCAWQQKCVRNAPGSSWQEHHPYVQKLPYFPSPLSSFLFSVSPFTLPSVPFISGALVAAETRQKGTVSMSVYTGYAASFGYLSAFLVFVLLTLSQAFVCTSDWWVRCSKRDTDGCSLVNPDDRILTLITCTRSVLPAFIVILLLLLSQAFVYTSDWCVRGSLQVAEVFSSNESCNMHTLCSVHPSVVGLS